MTRPHRHCFNIMCACVKHIHTPTPAHAHTHKYKAACCPRVMGSLAPLTQLAGTLSTTWAKAKPHRPLFPNHWPSGLLIPLSIWKRQMDLDLRQYDVLSHYSMWTCNWLLFFNLYLHRCLFSHLKSTKVHKGQWGSKKVRMDSPAPWHGAGRMRRKAWGKDRG